MSTQTMKIIHLGAQGHGIAGDESGSENGPVYVPYALPGEVVKIARNGAHGALISIAEVSPDRIAPLCRHFNPDGDACGGCSLQHLADEPYRAFKRNLVIDALKSRGLTAEVGELVACRPGERRRTVFSARNTEKGLLLGFNRAQTNHIVAIEECPIAAPGIVARLAAIREIGTALAIGSDAFRLTVTETLSGLDVAADGLKAFSDRQRRAVTEAALRLGCIARVSVDGEVVIEQQKPLLDFGGVKVSPPPGGFTQATRQAEEAMAELVLSHLRKSKRVLDLFAGSGTFALRLARKAKVHAVEGDAHAIKALDFAARNTPGLKPVTAEKRDLFRRPMMVSELKGFDGVVFDPPRAGAEAQVKELARGAVKKVAAVSCNPMTLARDLRILVDGGYRIISVTPIDQFLWSPHVEAVALLEK